MDGGHDPARNVKRWIRRSLCVLGAASVGLGSAHLAIGRAARLEPPTVALPSDPLVTSAGLRRLGESYTRRRGGVTEARLVGTPEQIGWAHGRLLGEEMRRAEGAVWTLFDRLVPSRLARAALLDLAELRYRRVDREMSAERLREIAAEARAFQPDPFAEAFETYQRFVYLNALYDISLSFERSPLIGCTTFTVAPERSRSGPLLARAFDFDVDDVFDREKVVFLVRESGSIPFASVAWPGLVGVVSGMNLEGLAVVVHGGRAGEPRTQGEPVVHALRRVLSSARTTDEAVARLGERDPMVSHLVVVTDASGDAAVIERVPGAAPHVRRLTAVAVVTNHLEGPSADDPANRRVRASTTTLERRARGDELAAAMPAQAGVPELWAALRDRHLAGGADLPAGDRRAIDADIATHAVVLEVQSRTLWVSEGPHLRGRLLAFPLRELLDPAYPADTGLDPPASLP